MWEAIASNKRRSALLIFGLAAVLIGLGYVIGLSFDPEGGLIGLGFALVLWLILTAVAFSAGKEILLSSVGAREIKKDDHPVLFNVVEEMTIASGLPKMPRVFILDQDAPNAFAVGTPQNAAVAVTSGLLMKLNRDELQAVVGHEIGHIHNQDTRFMTLAGVMVAAIVLIADMFLRSMRYGGMRRRRGGKGAGGAAIILVVALLFAILAPIVAQLLYFACSRKREYLADACSARFTRYPEGLASALEKIAGSAGRMAGVNRAVAPMFTINPLQSSAVSNLFSSHPPTADRVRVLRSMGGAGYAAYERAFESALGGRAVGVRTLAQSDEVAVREASPEAEKEDLAKAREVTDILHRFEGFLCLQCACGLRIKVPEGYKKGEVQCPKCGRAIPVPAAALAAAGAAVMAASGALDEVTGEPAAEGAGAQPQEPGVIWHRVGEWESVRCTCGKTIQLSPALTAAEVACHACGRTYRVRNR